MVDTLKLSEPAADRLIASIDRNGLAAPGHPDRRGLRVGLIHRRMPLDLTPPEGPAIRHAVLPRNLSRCGMSFVLGQFIHAQTPCAAYLPDRQSRWRAVRGRIARCRHLGGIFHEAAAIFDEPVDIRDFARLTLPESERFRRELVREMAREVDHTDDPNERRVVRVLVSDPCEDDRRLIAHFLEAMALDAVSVDGIAGLSAALQARPELAVVSVTAADDLEIIRLVRAGRFGGSVIAVLEDRSQGLADAVFDAGADAALRKPFDREALADVVGNTLAVLRLDAEAEDSRMVSDYATDPAMRSLLADFVDRCPGTAREIRAATVRHDHTVLEEICQRVYHSAGMYGFARLSAAAGKVIAELRRTGQRKPHDAEEAVDYAVDDLVLSLRQVRAA